VTRAEKRSTILAALQEDYARSDRAIAALIGTSPTTVGAIRKTMPRSVKIEIGHPEAEPGHPGPSVQIGDRKLDSVQTGETETVRRHDGPDWLHDPAKRTPAAVAAWLIATFPDAVDRIIGALQRQRDATGVESQITISWEAGKAARDLVRLWSLERLDQLREEIAKGGPTRMTDPEKFTLWGSEKAPKSIRIPDDPIKAAAKLWLYWGARPSKLDRLNDEIARRTKAPKPIRVWNPEEEDIPF
jgi:hypothetical protein